MPKVYANGRHLFYEAEGQGDALVFLSGLGGDHRAFAVTIRHFSTRFRCFGLDARDCGQSDLAEDGYTTADMAADVAACLEALEIPSAHVVGHSLGGMVAQELAIRFPERVKSLVLVSTHAGSDLWRKAVLTSWILVRGRTDPAEFARATLPWLVAPRFFEHAAQVEGLIRFAERNQWPQSPDAFARQARAAENHEARNRLGQIRAPTLVVNGENDLVNPPRFALTLVKLIPGAKLEIVPDVGHLPHIEDGPRFRASVQAFLDLASQVHAD